MTARNYSNTASDAEVAVLIGSTDLSVALANYTGFPDAPYIAALDPDTADEEIVLVTNVASSTVTMTRAYDGSTAKTHSAGAVFRHVAAAVDFAEANDHVQATTGVHGVAGAVVGTSDTQTLSNKTLSSPTITAPTVTGTMTAAGAAFSGTVTLGTVTAVDLTAGTASVTGPLDVAGATTLAAVTATDVDVTTLDASGAVTVGGTLGVTGALTGTSGAFSGAVSGLTGTFTTTIPNEIELVQQASDLTPAAGRSSLYAKTDFGLWFTPNGQTARRTSMHWGSGSTLPTTGAISGDTFYATTVSSMLRYNGTTWRQIDGPVQIANMAARPATTAVGLHAGFQVFSLSDDDTYTWDGTFWRNALAGGYSSGAGTGDYITGIVGTSTVTVASSAVTIPLGRTYSAAPGFALMAPGNSASGLGTVTANSAAYTTSAVAATVRTTTGATIAGGSPVQVTWYVIGYNN